MSKELEITLNDYAKLMMLPDGRQTLDSQIASNHSINYESRLNSISKDASPETRVSEGMTLRGLSQSQYDELKIAQMRQLYNAYTTSSHGLMWIEPNQTSEDAVRRVVGPNAGQAYNTGAMFLNVDEIQAINYLAGRAKNEGINHRFSTYSLGKATDDMIAIRDIVAKEFGLTYPDTSISSITRNTSIGDMVYGEYSKDGYTKAYDRESLKRIIERSKVSVEKRNRRNIIERLLGKEKELNKGDEIYKTYERE